MCSGVALNRRGAHNSVSIGGHREGRLGHGIAHSATKIDTGNCFTCARAVINQNSCAQLRVRQKERVVKHQSLRIRDHMVVTIHGMGMGSKAT